MSYSQVNPTKSLLVPKVVLFLIALVWTGVVFYFCLMKSSSIPVIEIYNLDKCVHAFFYFVFTLVWFLYFKRQLQSPTIIKSLIYSFLFSFLFGIGIELLQQLCTTTRNGDVLDVAANVTGATLAVIMISIGDRWNLWNSIIKN